MFKSLGHIPSCMKLAHILYVNSEGPDLTRAFNVCLHCIWKNRLHGSPDWSEPSPFTYDVWGFSKQCVSYVFVMIRIVHVNEVVINISLDVTFIKTWLKNQRVPCMMPLVHSCTIACFVCFSFMAQRNQKNQNSILIINFLFKIFINLLSEMVEVSYFCF